MVGESYRETTFQMPEHIGAASMFFRTCGEFGELGD